MPAEDKTTREVTVYDDTVREGLKAGARAMGDVVEWQHLSQGVAAFLRAFDPSERFAPHLLAAIAEEVSDAG